MVSRSEVWKRFEYINTSLFPISSFSSLESGILKVLGAFFWLLLSHEKCRLNLSVAPWASDYLVCSSHHHSHYQDRGGKTAPSEEDPVVTDASTRLRAVWHLPANCRSVPCFSSMAERQIYLQTFLLMTLSLFEMGTNCLENGLLSFPPFLKEGSFTDINTVIDIRINVCMVASPPSLCACAVHV